MQACGGPLFSGVGAECTSERTGYDQLLGLRLADLVEVAARLRPGDTPNSPATATKFTLCHLARRYQQPHAETAELREGFVRASLYEPNDRFITRMRRAERQAKRADRGMWGQPCDYDTPPPTEPPPPPQVDAPAEQPDGCEPGYDPCVSVYPPDVDCGDVTVTGSDPHGLDGNGDGIACEG